MAYLTISSTKKNYTQGAGAGEESNS